MRIINVTPKMDALLLGKQGENKSTKFLFDVSGWLEDYPGCSIGLNYRPAKSNVSYPCVLTNEDDGMKGWLITSSELVNDGDGEAELVCILDEVVEKDKRTWKTKVNKSMGGSGTAPDPWENWEDTFIELAERAEDAAEDAEDAKEAAEEAARIAAHAPIIQDGYWYTWDATTEQYVNTEVKAQGEDGDPGQDATPALITVDYSELTFPVAEGKLCYHSGLLYKANQAIATSEAWTAAHWTQTTIEAEQHALKTEINTTADDVDDIKELLEMSDPVVGYTFPDAYKSANYSNSKGTAQYKYVNDKLYMKKAESFGEVSTSSASISNNASAAYVVDGSKNVYLPIAYVNNNSANIARLLIRYYDDDFNSSTTAYVYLPVGTGEMTVELVKLATDNNINLSQKKNVILRGMSLAETQGVEPGSAEVTFDGFGVEQSAENKIDEIDYRLDALEGRANNAVSSSTAGNNPQFYDEFCAHLFLNTTSDNTSDIYVPSQSLYDIEISKRLGFKVIEVNTHATSDGKYVCLHGTGGTFGTEFGAADGSTYSDAEVQGTTITEVTMDWIKNNVRCRAKYPKYRTAPLSLEEFLLGCKQLNMVPRINYKGQDQIAIANGIMGKDNYILYGASKYARPYTNAPILGTSRFESKQEVLDWMAGVGNPVIWNPLHLEDFTDAQWKEIIEAVHNFGGMITFPTGYADVDESQHFLNMGFDCGTSGFYLNKCNSGNMANLSADDNFSEFTVSGGTASDGQLTMTQNGTITNATALSQVFLSGMWLDITYKGSISVSMGRWITHSDIFSSADGETIHLSTYGINLAPTFQIKATENDTIIENIVFKASKM